MAFKRLSLGSKIEQTDLFRSGKMFTARDMAQTLKAEDTAVMKALERLVDQDKAKKTRAGFYQMRERLSSLTMPLRTQRFDFEREVIGPREWSRVA